MSIVIRYAAEADLPRVNQLRRVVNDLHVQGRPDIFRPGFNADMQKHLYDRFFGKECGVIVADMDGQVAGYAMVEIIVKPESPYNLARSFYHVEEFGVDPTFRRQGVATALVNYMKDDARAKGLPKIELDMWSFNEGALAFYEAAGFTTYRRYMELPLDE